MGKFIMNRLAILFSVSLTSSLFLHCSESTEPTPLEDILYGTYSNVWADYQPDSTSNLIVTASPSDSVYLVLNPDNTYKMRLELFVESLDTLISSVQIGSFELRNTRYTEAIDWGPAHWDGQIQFLPTNSPNWGGNFTIITTVKNVLSFTEFVFISIPNSEGRVLLYSWSR